LPSIGEVSSTFDYHERNVRKRQHISQLYEVVLTKNLMKTRRKESFYLVRESSKWGCRGGTKMYLILTAIFVAVLCVLIATWIKRTRERHRLEQHSITPEELHRLLASDREVLLLDVRRPLDLLAHPEVIPGAKRIPPKEVLQNPSLIPKEQESVVYCTCPGDETSRAVLQRALALHRFRVKFLRGGLAAWKAKGYEVEPYRESFHLDTAS
jgi:rhodanese-related sulfurtransferase